MTGNTADGIWVPDGWDQHSRLRVGLTTASWGNMSPYVGDPQESLHNRTQLAEHLSLGDQGWTWAEQVHGTEIAEVTVQKKGTVGRCDGLASGVSGTALMGFFADCVPVLLAEPRSGIGAVVHAGWRGTAGGVVQQGLLALVRHGVRVQNIHAAVGPCIQGNCYEVGKDTAARFPKEVVSFAHGTWRVNLLKANMLQLTKAGVLERNIAHSHACTHCSAEYFSHRRQGARAGRMAAFLILRS